MGDDRLCRSAEERQEIVDHAPVSRLAADRRREHQRVADLAGPGDGALLLEPLDDGLDGGVGGTFPLGQSLPELAHRSFLEAPEHVHDLQFEARQIHTMPVVESTTRVVGCQEGHRRLLGCWVAGCFADCTIADLGGALSNPATQQLSTRQRPNAPSRRRVLPPMSDVLKVLLAAMDEAYEKNGWHGTTLRNAVRGVEEEAVYWRPAPGRHNLWELTVHAAYWKYAVRRRLLGGIKRGSFPLKGSNWIGSPDDANQPSWHEAV